MLLDVNMPGESGLELLEHIRTDYPATAVVMVTGEDDLELAMERDLPRQSDQEGVLHR